MDRLSLQEAIQIAGYSLGTILHLLLLWLFIRRHRRRPGESLFAGFVCAVGLWNFGQFLATFFHVLLRNDVPTPLLVVCDLLAYSGLALIPSTLLHTLGLLVYERKQRDFHSLSHKVLRSVAVFLIYSPLLCLPLVIQQTLKNPGTPGFSQLQSIATPYFFWFQSSFLVCAGLSFVLARQAREPRERLFYLANIATLLGTCTVLALIYVTHTSSIAAGGVTVEGLVILLSTLPSASFGYYIHRYDDVEFFLRRSLFYIVLIGATLIAYLWGISVFAEMLDTHYGLNQKIVEGVLILALIVLFHPFRRILQKVFNSLFFKQTFAYQQVLTELVSFMGRGTAIHVRALVEHVTQSVERVLDLEDSDIVLTAPSGATSFAQDPMREPPELSACLQWFEKTHWPYFRRMDLGTSPAEIKALEELNHLRAQAIFAVRHESRIVALFLVGAKRDGSPLFAEEIEVLRALAEHLAISLENLKLYEQNRDLENQLHDTEKRIALGRFSSSVAHRVKNPLSSIKAITQSMALDMNPQDERRNDLLLVVSEVDRLTGIVNQLLNFAEQESVTQGHHFSLAEIITEVSELFQHEADLFQVSIQSSFEGQSPKLSGTRADMREILSNIIQNGIHAMKSGGMLHVRVESPCPSHKIPEAFQDKLLTRPSVSWCLIQVIDEGLGLPGDQADRVFEPFFTTKTGGTGLGLAITRRKIQEQGGFISAGQRKDSKPGAIISILMPLAQSPKGGQGAVDKQGLDRAPPHDDLATALASSHSIESES